MRTVVLAPFRRCARPGPSTPDAAPERAARGGGSCDCVSPSYLCLSSFDERALAARARRWFESCERAHAPRQPSLIPRDTAGGCHGACANWGMTRTNDKPSLRSRSGERASVLEGRARLMRASPTSTEQLLWARIRGRRLGVVFRRQVPLLGRFIADFLAPAQRLVIEVDGAYHGERGRADARRDAALERAGYRVIRVDASLVVSDIESALAGIRVALLA
jgi:very-short-patch-repair endonuclease